VLVVVVFDVVVDHPEMSGKNELLEFVKGNFVLMSMTISNIWYPVVL
jgi:hypothetical protein